MPSIRRSLIAYFLILLAVALAAVGVLVDRFAGDAMRGREEAEARRIEQEYEVRSRESKEQFDRELESQAIALGKEYRLHSFLIMFRDRERGREPEEWEKRYRLSMAFLPVGAVGGNPWPGVVSTAASIHPRFRQPVMSVLHRPQIELQRQHFDEQLRQAFADSTEPHPKYYQFHSPRSRRVVLRNPHARAELPPFPIDEYNQAPTSDFVRYSSEVVAGEQVLRVVIKSPLTGGPFRGLPVDLGRPPGPMGGESSAPPPLFDPLQFIYVQAGRPVAELEGILADHDSKRQADRGKLTEETQEAMTGLRVKLALIAGLAFAALAVGGWLLVGRGVAPIRKLSDAVSRVSEKDFHLSVAQEDLSVELLPIHGRLTDTLDALRAAFEREKQAVADISHELKTPIAALLTGAQVALRKPRTAEEYRAALEECRDTAQRLRRLVDRIMTLASLDAGNDHTTAERVDASDVATECAANIRRVAEEHGLTFSTAVDGDAELVTDPDKLREVLNNLLQNAVEYNRPGGSVGLRVSADRRAVTFEVQDTGIGMTPEVRARIFERFYRADPSRTQTGVHAGLGLAIVKEYVDRLGGTIDVQSEPGAGSTFRVALPLGGADGNGSVGRSGYIPSPTARTRPSSASDLAPATPPR